LAVSLPPSLRALERVFWRLRYEAADDHDEGARWAGAAPAVIRRAQRGMRVEDRQWARERPTLTTHLAAAGKRGSAEEVERLAAKAARAAVETSAGQVAAGRGTSPAGPRPTATGGHRLSPPSAPPADVEQLAEQVIRQIDRRMVAYRERMGRSF
jgi:hypothetical protein